MRKTITYDQYDYGVIMIIQCHLQYIMDHQPNLNSLKNKHYQEPYEKGQQSILKFLGVFNEMSESFKRKK
jgi:hypothetical protein